MNRFFIIAADDAATVLLLLLLVLVLLLSFFSFSFLETSKLLKLVGWVLMLNHFIWFYRQSVCGFLCTHTFPSLDSLWVCWFCGKQIFGSQSLTHSHSFTPISVCIWIHLYMCAVVLYVWSHKRRYKANEKKEIIQESFFGKSENHH